MDYKILKIFEKLILDPDFFSSIRVPYIISENSYLKPGLAKIKGSRRKRLYLYKPEDVKEYQNKLINLFSKSIQPIENKNAIVYILHNYQYSKRFFGRDVDNMVKLINDSLKIVLKVNDSRFMFSSGLKEKVKCDYETIETYGVIIE